RGSGSAIAGSRTYVPGDDPHRIDWASSARLSGARASDEFVVREFLAVDAPRVVGVVDRRSGMSVCPPGMPFLHKAEAAEVARGLIEASVAESRGLVGSLERDGPRPADGCPPTSGPRHVALTEHALPERDGPADGITGMFEFLTLHRRRVPWASFVFVLSDFLEATPLETWESALDRGWDIVPVVVQDPVWEQRFPDVDRVVAPLVGSDGRVRLVRLAKGESRAWRERHEARLAGLVDGLRSLGVEPVLIGGAARGHGFHAVPTWSAERQAAWGHAA